MQREDCMQSGLLAVYLRGGRIRRTAPRKGAGGGAAWKEREEGLKFILITDRGGRRMRLRLRGEGDRMQSRAARW